MTSKIIEKVVVMFSGHLLNMHVEVKTLELEL